MRNDAQHPQQWDNPELNQVLVGLLVLHENVEIFRALFDPVVAFRDIADFLIDICSR